MCNPRRVEVHLDRSVDEAWRQTITQVASASASVSENASVAVDIGLAGDLGDVALATLERVVAGEFPDHEGWTRDDSGRYTRVLEDVTVVYDPATRRMSVEARLTESVTAEARAAIEASGMTVGQVATDAVAHYYDDGWGGRTKERALGEAQVDADRRLGDAIQALHRTQHADEIRSAEEQARAQAEVLAQDELARRQADVRDALRGRLQVVVARAHERVSHTIRRAVGEACRQGLKELALRNGGRIINDQRTGSVVNLELEF
jgi:hypothetical protein